MEMDILSSPSPGSQSQTSVPLVVPVVENIKFYEPVEIEKKSKSLSRNCLSNYQKVEKYVFVALFAIFGCLLRTSIDYLTSAPNDGYAIVKTSFPNILGCILAGCIPMLLTTRSHLRIGLLVGMCGSLTTYGSWNQQISLLLTGAFDVNHLRYASGFREIIFSVFSFMGAYIVGCDIGKFLVGSRWTNCCKNGRSWLCAFSKPLQLGLVLFALLSVVLTFILVIAFFYVYPIALFICASGLFAPLGALLRYFFILFIPKLNCTHCSIVNNIPTGLMVVNILGCCIEASFSWWVYFLELNCVTLQIFQAFRNGVLSCFTSVSSFVSEFIVLYKNDEERFASYLYALFMLGLCLGLSSTINVIGLNILFAKYTEEIQIHNMTVTFYEWKSRLLHLCV